MKTRSLQDLAKDALGPDIYPWVHAGVLTVVIVAFLFIIMAVVIPIGLGLYDHLSLWASPSHVCAVKP